MKGVLRTLTEKLDASKVTSVLPKTQNGIITSVKDTETITHDWLWPKLGDFLKPRDIVVTETGTSNFGIISTKFPQGVTALNQVLWGSIGWSVGACQGAALAAKDANDDRRTILFVGDGSIQLTAQEISTMIRQGLKPIM
jgi:pyruvate decarboxylase